MTILFETTTRELNPIGIVFMVIMIILAIISTCAAEHIDFVVGIIFLIAIAMCFCAAMTIGTEHHRKIKATISDEYSVVELYDKYDVAEREGDIWTLVEKEPMVERLIKCVVQNANIVM